MEDEFVEKSLLQVVDEWLIGWRVLITGGILFAAGVAGQMLSDKTLSEIPYILMMCGVQCGLSVLISKLGHIHIPLIWFIFGTLAFFLVMRAGYDIRDYRGIDSFVTTICAVIIICLWWWICTRLIRDDSIGKRVRWGSILMVGSILIIGITFFIPIVISQL